MEGIDKSDFYSTVDILGVKIHCVDFAQTLDQIAAWIDATKGNPIKEPLYSALRTPHFPCRPHQICTINPEFIMEARRNPQFAIVLRRADLCVPDGVGVIWAARQQGVPLRERVTGSDGLYRICQRAAAEGWRVYFLGAAPGVAAQAADLMQAHYPGLTVAGTYSGTPTDAGWPEIAARLQKAVPDILFVAFGHPRQEIWIDQHRAELPVAVAMGVGGAFDFAAGVAVRAPTWIRRLGLEWLHRLIRQPWRWRRMLRLPWFVVLVWWQAVRRWGGGEVGRWG